MTYRISRSAYRGIVRGLVKYNKKNDIEKHVTIKDVLEEINFTGNFITPVSRIMIY